MCKAVKDADNVSLPPLRHGPGIRKLRAKLRELARIEKESKGKYSVQELNAISEKPDLEAAIDELEARSRGWFEDDETFQERLEINNKAAAGAGKKGGSASKPAASSGGYAKVVVRANRRLA